MGSLLAEEKLAADIPLGAALSQFRHAPQHLEGAVRQPQPDGQFVVKLLDLMIQTQELLKQLFSIHQFPLFLKYEIRPYARQYSPISYLKQ